MEKRRLRASAVCEAEGHLLVVRLRDPTTGVEAPYPPGGGIEHAETPGQTAERETLEETGVQVRIVPEIEQVERYPFRWDGVDYDVTTHYLFAKLDAPFVRELPRIDDADYNLGGVWLPTDSALSAMAVHPEISGAVRRVLRLGRYAQWEAHRNFAGPASTLLGIHQQFRRASERLLLILQGQADDDLGWVGRAFAPLGETLHHHHHAEELMLFPLIERRTGVAPEALVDDHGELTDAIAAVESHLVSGADRGRARAAVERFDTVLIEHLDREEGQVVPVLLELRPAEAWTLIHGAGG